MPEEQIYYPSITIKAYDSRLGFGRFTYVGVCKIPTIYAFMQRLVTKNEYENAIYHSTKKSRVATAAVENAAQQCEKILYIVERLYLFKLLFRIFFFINFLTNKIENYSLI